MARRCLAALAAILIAAAAAQVHGEECVNPTPSFFGELKPVSDEGLAEVSGTGVIVHQAVPRNELAVILWDEQPKIKPVPHTSAGESNGSQTIRATIRVQ
jgi:hypothetical protein